MKKIFVISVLSVMAVVATTNAWATETLPNYNLATANYVEDRYDSAVEKAENLVITSDKKTSVAGWSNSSGWAGSEVKAPTIKYMEDSIAEAVAGVDTSGLVDKAQVINSQAKNWKDVSVETDAAANPDNYVATWGAVQAKVEAEVDRVEDAIDGTVAGGLATKVDRAEVIKADGTTTLAGTTVDATTLNKDTVAPTIANVEANFVPRVGDAVYNGRPYDTDSMVGNIDVTNLPSGEYSVIVSVDGSGNMSFRWVPIQIDRCNTTDGYTCGPA